MIKEEIKMKVPEVRFEGFEGEWEEKKLGDMMEVKSVKRIHQSIYFSQRWLYRYLELIA